MATEPLRIGTRASQLALTQTGWVAESLRTWTEDVTIVEVSTRGDLRQDTPIHRFGGDGVFHRRARHWGCREDDSAWRRGCDGCRFG